MMTNVFSVILGAFAQICGIQPAAGMESLSGDDYKLLHGCALMTECVQYVPKSIDHDSMRYTSTSQSGLGTPELVKKDTRSDILDSDRLAYDAVEVLGEEAADNGIFRQILLASRIESIVLASLYTCHDEAIGEILYGADYDIGMSDIESIAFVAKRIVGEKHAPHCRIPEPQIGDSEASCAILCEFGKCEIKFGKRHSANGDVRWHPCAISREYCDGLWDAIGGATIARLSDPIAWIHREAYFGMPNERCRNVYRKMAGLIEYDIRFRGRNDPNVATVPDGQRTVSDARRDIRWDVHDAFFKLSKRHEFDTLLENTLYENEYRKVDDPRELLYVASRMVKTSGLLEFIPPEHFSFTVDDIDGDLASVKEDIAHFGMKLIGFKKRFMPSGEARWMPVDCYPLLTY